MDFILRLFNEFNAYSKSNPLVAGAVSLWGLGVVTFIFRNLPKKVGGFLWSQTTTTLSFNNEDLGSNLITFANFIRWFNIHHIKGLSRSVALLATSNMSTVGMGTGRHYFIYKRHLFIVQRSQANGQGGTTKQVIFNMTVTMLGRNRKIIEALIDEFRFRDDISEPTVYTATYSDSFNYGNTLRKRNLSSVIVPRKVRKAIMHQIEEFRTSEEWYNHHGIPYKLAMVLQGGPGTGKTSLVRALASHYSMHLCIIMPHQMADRTFFRLLQAAPENSIILIEDFDSATATNRRAGMGEHAGEVTAVGRNVNGQMVIEVTEEPGADVVGEIGKSLTDMLGAGATLSGILNAIDGPVPLHNKIIIMTTNVIQNIDPALLRPGRVDHIHEIGPLDREEIEEYIRYAYPDAPLNLPRQVMPITGAQLQSLFMKHRRDPTMFMRDLVGFDSIHYRGETRDVARDFQVVG